MKTLSLSLSLSLSLAKTCLRLQNSQLFEVAQREHELKPIGLKNLLLEESVFLVVDTAGCLALQAEEAEDLREEKER